MDTAHTAQALVEALRRSSGPDVGPETASYLLATIADDVARAQAEDPYGLADLLAQEHRTLSAALASWDERDRAWQRQRTAARAQLGARLAGLEDVLHEIAKQHRRRTSEATLRLPSGSHIATQESRDVTVVISDAAAFMAAVKDREDLPEGVIVTPPPALGMVAAKAYAKLAFDVEAGEIPPGVVLIPAGRVTASVKHD